ncbi:MAG: catechol 1,2-dioxygenase [Catenulispora sp.]|nr:catechol 1,2-dioxygenase [Catenulispora sp.]
MIVLGVGASHSTLMNTHWEQTVAVEAATRFRDGLAEARDLIAATRPDAVVIVGSNHFRGFWLDLIPAFTIGVGECVASGESGTPSGPQTVHVELARTLTARLVEDGFDPAFSARLQIDHGQSHAVQYLLTGLDVPIVPIVVNVFAPPLPTLRRCADLGAALGRALGDTPERVVVIASGGLSHRLPWPDWRDPHGADEEFMVSAWLDGRDNWRSYDERRRAIVRAAGPAITPAFDTEFLSLLEAGRAERICALTAEELEERAGNGAQEIRTWLVMAAALGHAPARTISYDPVPDWLTGMAVAVLTP